MMPTNYYEYSEAIRNAVLKHELSVVLSWIEDDKYLTSEDKRSLRELLYERMEYTH